MALSRRKFLTSAIAGAGGAALGGKAFAASDYVNITRPSSTLLGGPKPRTNINHVVVVMMENRSTDHFLGWWGETEGSDFDARTDLPGRETHDFGASGRGNFSGHPFGDPSHNHRNGRKQIIDDVGGGPGDKPDGLPDGWGADLGTGTDEYALSYYTAADLPVINQILQDFTSFDRYFCSWMGNTYPNRYYMHSGQAHGIDNNDFPPQKVLADQDPKYATGYDWPTLWDYLTLRGVTWKYYYSNLPAIALFGARNLANTRHISEYYADCAAGTLPQVSFVDPFFVAPEGLANDDHPHADIRLGQEFYSDVVTSFLKSTNFPSGAMFITYDEWGGFWDHVNPPNVGRGVDPYGRFTDKQAERVDYRERGAVGPDGEPLHEDADGPGPNDFGLYGFRVPTFLLSPYARSTQAKSGRVGRTIHSQHDHTTILQFIADNWGLPDVGQWQKGHSRHAQGSMMDAFDPTVFVEGEAGDTDVEADDYSYRAPAEAREAPLPVPPSSVSALWSAADWMEDLGFTVHTRFADALPETRSP